MRRNCLAIVLLLAAPSVATANTSIATNGVQVPLPVPGPPPVKTDRRFELEVGLGGGIVSYGDLASMSGGAFLNLGWRVDDITVLAELGVQAFDARDSYASMQPRREGRQLRAGLAVRHSFFTVNSGIEIDLAGELAVERRFVTWMRGGNLQRNAITGALVLNMDFHDVKRGQPRGTRTGVHYAIRIGGAEAVPGSNGVDLSLLFELGMYFSP